MSSPQSRTGAKDSNRNEEIISASVTLLILPTIFVALRVVSRRLARASFWVCSLLNRNSHFEMHSSLKCADTYKWDDWTVILAMVSLHAKI